MRLWLVVAAAAIFLLLCIRVYSFRPVEFFDFFHDDAIYFSTAKALATGRGYIIPSFPGVLPQTKYPVLYPLVLSLVWRLWPSFPSNLGPAIALSISIAGVYLLVGFRFLRTVGGTTSISLSIIAAIALHPGLSFLAGNLLSDYLFAALILASAMAADEMCKEPERNRYWALWTGLLLALAMLVRSAAIGALAGTVLYAAQHKRWRSATGLTLTFLVVISTVALVTKLTQESYVAAGAGTAPIGFRHVLGYYRSYTAMWSLSVPNGSIFATMIWDNIRKMMLAPGNYLIMAGSSLPGNLVTYATALLLSTISVGGVVRWWGTCRRRAILFSFAGMLPVLIIWNYAIYERFLLPFVPIIFFGIIVECRRIVSLVTGVYRRGSALHRVIAVPIVFSLVAIILLSVYNYWHYGSDLIKVSRHREALNLERREAYNWIVSNTPRSARILAYEDGLVYLYTGRQAVRPVVISTDCYYQPEEKKCASDFSEMGSWLEYVGAGYWLTDSDDLEFEGDRRFRPEVKEYIANLKSKMDPIFASRSGNVVLYDATGLVNPTDPFVPSAKSEAK